MDLRQREGYRVQFSKPADVYTNFGFQKTSENQTLKAKDFLSKPGNENKAIEFRIENPQQKEPCLCLMSSLDVLVNFPMMMSTLLIHFLCVPGVLSSGGVGRKHFKWRGERQQTHEHLPIDGADGKAGTSRCQAQRPHVPTTSLSCAW